MTCLRNSESDFYLLFNEFIPLNMTLAVDWALNFVEKCSNSAWSRKKTLQERQVVRDA